MCLALSPGDAEEEKEERTSVGLEGKEEVRPTSFGPSERKVSARASRTFQW
jgi:hypothetical protein